MKTPKRFVLKFSLVSVAIKIRNWLARKVVNNKMEVFMRNSRVSLFWSMKHKLLAHSILSNDYRPRRRRTAFGRRMIYRPENRPKHENDFVFVFNKRSHVFAGKRLVSLLVNVKQSKNHHWLKLDWRIQEINDHERIYWSISKSTLKHLIRVD